MSGKISFMRTIEPKGIMQFTYNPPKGGYQRRPYTIQPDAYADGGDYYAYNKGLPYISVNPSYQVVSNSDIILFQNFLDAVAIRKTNPFLFREPDGAVLVGRFVNPDQITTNPVGIAYSSLSGMEVRCSDIALHISGALTQGNTAIMLQDGYASLDFSVAGVLTDHIGMLVDVFDGDARRVSGFILDAGASGGYASIVPTMVDYIIPAGMASSSTEFAGGTCPPWEAMDKVLSGDNGWLTAQGSLTGWIQYALPVPKIVKLYGIYPYETLETAAPKNWTLEGSNDGNTWTVIDTRTAVTSWTANTQNVYQVTAPGSYSYYRLDCTLNNGHAQYLGMAEWNMWEYEPTTTGVRIASAPGGSTINWTEKDPAFNPLDARGYTYKIYTEGI